MRGTNGDRDHCLCQWIMKNEENFLTGLCQWIMKNEENSLTGLVVTWAGLCRLGDGQFYEPVSSDNGMWWRGITGDQDNCADSATGPAYAYSMQFKVRLVRFGSECLCTSLPFPSTLRQERNILIFCSLP